MNVFVLDLDLVKCAEYHIDKHIVKMPLETAQLLCSTMFKAGLDVIYKPTHINHPWRKWLDISPNHFYWLKSLGIELCKEYTFRYGKRHKCQDIIEAVYLPNYVEGWDYKFIKEMPLCMPDNCKALNTVCSYRNYYNMEKSHLFKWKKRSVPEWVIYHQ